MTLSDYLTRNEWNACYFLGMKVKATDHQSGIITLADQLKAGIAIMHKSEYTFKGIVSFEDGSYVPVQPCSEENGNALIDVMSGNIDLLKRAKETLEFVSTQPVHVDFHWLHNQVKEAEEYLAGLNSK